MLFSFSSSLLTLPYNSFFHLPPLLFEHRWHSLDTGRSIILEVKVRDHLLCATFFLNSKIKQILFNPNKKYIAKFLEGL